MAERGGETKETFNESILRNMDMDLNYVYEDSLGNYHVKQASSKLDHTWTTDISFGEATRMSNKYASADYEEVPQTVEGGSAFNMLEGEKVLYVSPENS